MIQVNLDAVKSMFQPLTVETMQDAWQRLHAGDCEPIPESEDLANAWLLFHNGQFLEAAVEASQCEQGISLQLKAQATYAHYLEDDAEVKIRRFQETIKLAEQSLILETAGKSNSYYQIAYCLGRYGQFISVAKALAEGLAGRVRKALQDCLEQSPNHADANTALGTYQAEIIGKLGRIAAKLTYSASAEDSIQCYEKGIELAPYSVSAKTEYGDGLISIYGGKKRKQAISIYEQAVEHEPIDALEAMDYYIAKSELAEV